MVWMGEAVANGVPAGQPYGLQCGVPHCVDDQVPVQGAGRGGSPSGEGDHSAVLWGLGTSPSYGGASERTTSTFRGQHLWGGRYFCATVAVTDEMIREYVENQRDDRSP